MLDICLLLSMICNTISIPVRRRVLDGIVDNDNTLDNNHDNSLVSTSFRP